MFDDLRPKSSSPFEEDSLDEQETKVAPAPAKAPAPRKKKSSSGEMPILGMTAAQRLVISIMLFLDVTVLGCFLLLAIQAIVLPF